MKAQGLEYSSEQDALNYFAFASSAEDKKKEAEEDLEEVEALEK